MAITNNLLPQVDLPVWEWTRFAPGATSALTALTTARDGSSKYLYYFFGTQLYRYDTRADTWQALSVGGASVTVIAAEYVNNQGFRGHTLSATSNTIQIPSVGTDPSGYKIKIIAGKGLGQERTITSTAAEVVHDSGIITGISTALITDNTKKWKFNQWVGYGARVFFGAGFGQSREILYNDTTGLQVNDVAYEGRDFMTTLFNANAPYGTFTTSGGSQNAYQIVSQVLSIDTPWDIIPDGTTRFRIDSDGIWTTTCNSSSPYFQHFYYDILTDRWVTKLVPSGFLSSAFGTDLSLEPTSNLAGSLSLSGSVTSSLVTSFTSQSIVDTTISMTTGSFVGCVLRIESGSAAQGQERRIISNTDKIFTLSSKWDIMPDTTSRYSVTGESALYLVGNNAAKMYKYYPETSLWSQGNILDSGWASQFSLIRPTDKINSFGITTATRTTSAITGVNLVPTAGGSGYIVGDLLTVSTGGTLGRVYVESVSATGAVLSISRATAGSGYTIGTGKLTTGGTGTGCTIEITSIAAVAASITVPISHDLQVGESVTFAGAIETAWNQVCTVIGIQSLTNVELSFASTGPLANPVSLYVPNTTLLVDASKNWIPNEHAGKMLGVQASSLTGTTTFRKIIGNSATTVTFIAGTAPVNGTSRYFIQELEAFGDAESYLADNQLSYGYATNLSTTSSLVDSTKNWTLGSQLSQWTGNKVLLTDTSGSTMETIITSNTSSSLNIGRTVALGTGTANTIGYSDNQGVTWSGIGTTTFSTAGNGACWSGTRFVAVGAGTNTIAWSNDGITWVGVGITYFTTAGNGVAWNGTRFVAVGLGTNGIAYSNDGVTWAATALGSSTFSIQGNAVAWSGTRWVAAGEGANTLLYSLDGITWSIASNTLSTRASSVCWNGTKFLAGGSGTNILSISTDGITWSSAGITAPTLFTQVNGITWNGTRFVIVGTVSSGTNCIAYSADGLTWNIPNTTVFTTGNGVSWNGVNFIATGIPGTHTVAYSADGITWTGAITTSLFSTGGNEAASMSPFQSKTPNIGIVPANGVKYKIYDTTGTVTSATTSAITDNNKKWKANQWAGSRIVVTSGLGYSQEVAVTQNTANTISYSMSTAPDNTSTYTIIQKPVVAAGSQLLWNFGSTTSDKKARQLILGRGGSYSMFDIYDITTNRWKVGQYIQGMGELLSTGTMYTYDGKDRIYFTPAATGRIHYYDIKKNQIIPIGTIPYGMSTAILSNRMEMITTTDGLPYLYIMRHSGNEMWRTLIFN